MPGFACRTLKRAQKEGFYCATWCLRVCIGLANFARQPSSSRKAQTRTTRGWSWGLLKCSVRAGVRLCVCLLVVKASRTPKRQTANINYSRVGQPQGAYLFGGGGWLPATVRGPSTRNGIGAGAAGPPPDPLGGRGCRQGAPGLVLVVAKIASGLVLVSGAAARRGLGWS